MKYASTVPDLINSLLGTLIRFGKKILRFNVTLRKYCFSLWWSLINVFCDSCDGKMATILLSVPVSNDEDLFGAVWSMDCANVGIKRWANDYEHKLGLDAALFIHNCFYVDDGLWFRLWQVGCQLYQKNSVSVQGRRNQIGKNIVSPSNNVFCRRIQRLLVQR